MKHTMIELHNVTKRYQSDNDVLKHIDLNVEEGEFVAVMGASGSGKSTLLYAMSGLDRIQEGSVKIQGKDLHSLSEKQLAAFRLTHMGFVFQQIYLLKNLNLYDNILLPGVKARLQDHQTLCQRVDDLMKQTGIYECRNQSVSSVSGGQLQRAGICRALINQPKLIFADEPTGALNSKASKEIMDIFEQLHQQGTGIVVVTHDAKVGARAQRVIFMKDGELQGECHLGVCEGNEEKREAILMEAMRRYDL